MEFRDLFIDEEKTVVDALKQLDRTSKGILYVTDDNKLLAALTDGDTRRHLLNGGGLQESIKVMANYRPKYLFIEDRDQAQNRMKTEKIFSIPIVNHQKEILSICFRDEVNIAKGEDLNLPVVMMAGGKGTRLYPYTKVLPKPLIPIGDLPIAEHIMQQFENYGCSTFHLIVNHKKEMIKAYFSETQQDKRIIFYDEDKPLGTGGGLSLLKGKVKQPFFLTNCDIIVRADYNDILNFHKINNNIITIVCAYKHVTIPYGVITMGEGGEILDMVEKPEYSFLTNTGFYLVNPEVIDDIPDNTDISFPEIAEKQRAKGHHVAVYPIGEKAWLDMGQLEEMEEMKKELGVQ